METVEFIDLYCERTAAGFWNEPVNAISNLAFVIAALVAWRVSRRRENPVLDIWEIVLLILAALIGVGSFLFHTFANTQAELADVVPIWSFVALFVLVVVYRSTGEDLKRTIRIGAIVVGSVSVVFWFTSGDVVTDAHTHSHRADPFNGSLQYLPALIALLVFAGLTIIRRHPARFVILTAALMFMFSLLMRTIDLHVCEITGIGTHFLWHILNAGMVGLLLVALVQHYPPSRSLKT